MVVLLNIVPALLILAVIFSMYKCIRTEQRMYRFMLAGSIIVLWLYTTLQPSYLPKGEIGRSEVPAFAKSTAEIEDRNRRPVPQEERRATQEEQYRTGPVFLNNAR